MNIPKSVACILDTLQTQGYEAYIVGGCVRDCLLHKNPKDWDITTSAEPEQVKKCFTRTYDTGIKHGTVTVLEEGIPYEVTTYRVEGTYEDYRRPSEVFFTKSLVEDLKRRDFTMNAIAYHPLEGFIDPFGGIYDIQQKIIRGVGDPTERFQEDALRMLRAIRFSAQLDFTIEHDTWDAITVRVGLIAKVSIERIREEINKLLLSDHPEGFMLLHKAGMLPYFLPEFEACVDAEQHHAYHIYTVGAHLLKSVEYAPKDIGLRFAMLLHDIGKPLAKITDDQGTDHFVGHVQHGVSIARAVLKRLKFDHKTLERVVTLVQWHDEPIEAQPAHIRKILSILGEERFLDLIQVKEADTKAKHPQVIEDCLAHLYEVQNIYEEIKRNKDCTSMKALAINGEDLLKAGFPQNKQLGDLLQMLLEAVLLEPHLNTKQTLLQMAIDCYKDQFLS
jgi:tRNA nucleotidyltransferase (CCA-adding enzyme)